MIPKSPDPGKPGAPPRRDDTMGHAAYLSAFGFHRDPFPVAPDDEHFFLPKRIEILITEILHSLFVRKGFACLTGEIGLGKTTISRRILRELDDHGVETALIFNTFLQGEALLEAVARDFGLNPPTGNLQAIIAELNRFFLEKYEAGINCAILIDDAQELSIESLEMIRLISNLEHNARKLVQILLVGQPELSEKLANPRLRQLASRVVLHGSIEPFTQEETAQYVHYKLASAGCAGCLDMPGRTMDELHRISQGNPRRINILMDRCLYLAFASDRRRLTPAMLRSVVQEVNAIPVATPPRVSPPWQRHAPGLLVGGALALLLALGLPRMAHTPGAWPWEATTTAPVATPAPAVAAKPDPAPAVAAKPDPAPAVAVETPKSEPAPTVAAKPEPAPAVAAAASKAEPTPAVAAKPDPAPAVAVETPKPEPAPAVAAAASKAEPTPAVASKPEPTPAVASKPEPTPAVAVEAPKPEPAPTAEIPAAPAVPESVVRFLAAYGLEKHQPLFLEAWRNNTWEGLSDKVMQETGLRLVRLPAAPREARRAYPTLRLADGHSLLFWRPDVTLESVAYGAQGEGIRLVQERLAKLGMYHLPVDGVVGWGMRQALTRLQRLHKLPLSGDATPETLFLLSVLQPVAKVEEGTTP